MSRLPDPRPPLARPAAARPAAPIAGVPAAALAVVLAVALAGAADPAFAQSGGSLKLGEEPPPPTLDLGASPATPAPGDDAPAAAPGTDSADGPIVTPEDAVRTTHGDWEVACAPGEERGGCAMAQIGNDADGTPVLEMVIRKLAEPLEVNEETAVAVLDVITPLGVVLTEGLTMTIDSGRDESAAFQICTEQGCLVREPVGEELIARLRRGGTAKISVIAASQGEVTSDISLRGFTAAWNATR